MFECEIPGRVGIKKNAKRAFARYGRVIVLPSERYSAWEKMAQLYVIKAMQNKVGGVLVQSNKVFPIEDELHAEYEFYFKNYQAEADVSNCIEGPQDLMQKVGVIADDKQIQSLSAVKYFGHEPKTIIRLYLQKEMATAVEQSL